MRTYDDTWRYVATLASAASLSLMVACGDTPTEESEPAADATGEDPAGSTGGADDGGSAGDDTTAGDPPAVGANWHEDVAPIVVGRCSGCHRDGGIAPFPFANYDETQSFAEAIAVAVESGSMPPFGADETEECQPKLGWKNDLRLSDDEIGLLREWADGGAPEGDPALAAPIPEPPATELEDPDQRLQIPTSVTIEGEEDSFLCFSLDPELTEDAFLSAIQVVPGNDKVVHHVLIYTDAEGTSAELADENGFFECNGGAIGGDLVGAWAPGALPNRMPPDTGMHVPAGARIVMNIHYHPTGVSSEVDDSTSIDLAWHDERPTLAAALSLVGNAGSADELLPGPNDDNGIEFRIPAGVSDHTESMEYVLDEDYPQLRVFSAATHMHYVGVDMKVEVEHPNGETECLIQTPKYDFTWQRSYQYDAPLSGVPVVGAGDIVKLRCTYDNTMNNPGVAQALEQAGLDAPVDVLLGEETLDEMCLGVFGVVFPNFL